MAYQQEVTVRSQSLDSHLKGEKEKQGSQRPKTYKYYCFDYKLKFNVVKIKYHFNPKNWLMWTIIFTF